MVLSCVLFIGCYIETSKFITQFQRAILQVLIVFSIYSHATNIRGETESKTWRKCKNSPYHERPIYHAYYVEAIQAFWTIEWNRILINHGPEGNWRASSVQNSELKPFQWNNTKCCNVSYPLSRPKGKPHIWQPVQMRSSARLKSSSLYNRLLTNIFSFRCSSRSIQGDNKKISKIDASNMTLHDSVRHDTSESEKQSLDVLFSGNFQLRKKWFFFWPGCST